MTVFIGLINLLPLPPFDGGHLAMLAIEKMRGGRPVDMRKVIPVSAVVMAFFVTFVIGHDVPGLHEADHARDQASSSAGRKGHHDFSTPHGVRPPHLAATMAP